MDTAWKYKGKYTIEYQTGKMRQTERRPCLSGEHFVYHKNIMGFVKSGFTISAIAVQVYFWLIMFP